MRWLKLVLICALCSKFVDATAIVAVVLPGAIYIGADSRLTKTTASGGVATTTDGCKISQTPAVAFAVSALSSDSRTGFDFGAITRTALVSTNGPLDARIDAVEAALGPKLKAAVEGIRTDFPQQYETFRKGTVGQALFAAWEDGHPVLIEDDWKITPEGDIHHERFRANDAKNLLMIGSGGDAILRYVSQHATWWMPPIPDALERLIHAAIDDAAATHADDVGGEISILTVDSDGQKWVRTGKCGETSAR